VFRDSGRRKIRPLLFWLSGNSAVLRRHCARADIARRSSHGAATRGAGTLGGDLVTKLRLGALLVEDIEGRQVDVGKLFLAEDRKDRVIAILVHGRAQLASR